MTLKQKIRQAKKIKNRNKRVAAIRLLIEEHEDTFGVEGFDDGTIAKKYGVSSGIVSAIRKARGIPAYVHKSVTPKSAARIALEKDPELATASSMVLAARYGIASGHVRSVRKALGIRSPYRRYKPSDKKYKVRERKIDENNKSLHAWKRPMGIDPLLEEIREQV